MMKSSHLMLGASALLVSAATASASLLIHESFDYAAGAVNGAASTAVGLTGNWTAGAFGSGATTASAFQAGSLAFAGHFASTGGSLQITNAGPGWAEGGASLAVGATLTGHSTLYASSIMRFASSGSFFNDWVVEQRFNSSVSGTFSSASGRNIVRAFNSGSGSAGKGGVSSNGSEVAQSTGTNAAATNHLIVTRYTVSGSNITGATAYFFTEAAYANYLAAATPGTADALLATHALYSLSDSDSVGLTSFAHLQFVTQGGPIGSYDDFRLGTEITDVVNVSSIPEPSSFAALAGVSVLAAGLARRRRR